MAQFGSSSIVSLQRENSLSPHHDPTLMPSYGSQYEMDLDALGLNSTFDSSILDSQHELSVNRLEASDVDGPEDFTMNMTYWMTAEIPKSQQLNSRKEAQLTSSIYTTTTEGLGENRNIVTNANSFVATINNEKKVRSFLDALPNTVVESKPAGTPTLLDPHVLSGNSKRPHSKAPSLQPTVEEYAPPRIITQDTVVHHLPATRALSIVSNSPRHRIHPEIRTISNESQNEPRTTAFEIELSHLRLELEQAQIKNAGLVAESARLRQENHRIRTEGTLALSSADARLHSQEKSLTSGLTDFGEEIQMQSLSRTESQRQLFDPQIQQLKASMQRHLNDIQTQNPVIQDSQLDPVQSEAVDLKKDTKMPQLAFITQELSLIQDRADTLQSELAKALSTITDARERASRDNAVVMALARKLRVATHRTSSLECKLQLTKFQLECAEAETQAKCQLFQINMDLHNRLRENQKESAIAGNKVKQDSHHVAKVASLETRVECLVHQLQTTKLSVSQKDEEILRQTIASQKLEMDSHVCRGRMDGLEGTIKSLRQELGTAHYEGSLTMARLEHFEQDVEQWRQRFQSSHSDHKSTVADKEETIGRLKEVNGSLESRIRVLMSEKEDLIQKQKSTLDDVQEKAEQALRKIGTLVERERDGRRRALGELQQIKTQLQSLQDSKDLKTNVVNSFQRCNSVSSSHSNDQRDFRRRKSDLSKDTQGSAALRMETLKLKQENDRLKKLVDSAPDLRDKISLLERQLHTIHAENVELRESSREQQREFEAINKAMDERLAVMLSNTMKEKAKVIVGKRDGQWQVKAETTQLEKQRLGKILLRQWGREEVGIADEAQGEQQRYRYRYVK